MAMFDIGKRGTGNEREAAAEPEFEPRRAQEPGRDAPAAGGGVRRREAAVVGPSIHIDGTLKGEEDLMIEGHVTGNVQLQDHSLTIGPNGRVEADLFANVVNVEGVVEGDLYGSERVVIRSSARVKGNITAPRVSLDDGAWFKGAIEMDPAAVESVLGRKPRGAAAGGGDSAAAASKDSTPSSSTGAAKSDAAKAESGGKSGAGSSGQAESSKQAGSEQSAKASGAGTSS
ncbi:bactofilin family protein [Aquisalimonas asiatica]|uniref:Polymer-forming protein n=1 Tax=Aquisalimonas asiatica TaxID=406100 RepID=A0A1H8RR55_9GAMM|nr:polymer-forming cytoskeletal protein [Aquisalimonas asiatica]SEO68443.1 Polymer-forming protein [Aquisalimonas asiatica]